MTRASSVPVWFGAHVLHATENQDVVEGDDPYMKNQAGPEGNLDRIIVQPCSLMYWQKHVFFFRHKKTTNRDV